MIALTESIWIGDSGSWKNLGAIEIDSVLNVAQDLRGRAGWPEVEYAHVGIIDGPGNPTSAYCAAVLMVHTLLECRGPDRKLLVICHDGGRALAVCLMYLILKAGKVSDHPTFLNYWTPWDKILKRLSDRIKVPLPEVNPVHREAFDRLPLSLLESLT